LSIAAHEEPAVNIVYHVLATLAAVIGLGFLLARLCRRVGQPPVVGEIVAGIMLGPSLLGRFSPEAMHALIPSAQADPHGHVAAALMTVSQLGVMLYMFLVGLELNAGTLRHHAGAAFVISQTSIIVPLLSGAALALWLHPLLSHRGVPLASFALFMGVAMAITAFPVLSRVLTDRGLQGTSLGVTALTCAAADDVTAWCLLALVVGVAQARVREALVVGASVIAFILAMWCVIRPLANRCCRRLDASTGPLPPGAVVGTFVSVLVAALVTEAIGVHAVFGAFLLGAIIPTESRLAQQFLAKLRDPVTVLLLPAFFAYTGMRTRLELVAGWEDWAVCGVILLVATIGKFGGTLMGARWTGQSWRQAAALGVLMNTRGLMELVVLNIGLDLGIISPKLFSMMVIMAIATTIATGPLLRLFMREPPA
jgi:Kef-type K+ transport system membrane component KefB